MENRIEEVKDCLEIEEYSIKIVIVGDSGVGKSNILTRYVQDEFNQDSKATVGVELSTKTYKINDKFVKVHLWDTAGQERYKSITSAYYKGAKGAMIVYDITRPETFNNVDKWFNEIREFGEKNVVLMMVGNKSDLTHLRAVETKTALDKAEMLSNVKLILGVPVMETSALDSSNIDTAFKQLINGSF
jgi:Ras-related protein Rab-11A